MAARASHPILPVAVAVAVVAVWLASAPPALATALKVTIAARQCPSFQAISANRARNNIMESLQDLGPDTPYGQHGIPNIIDPDVEAAAQPKCVPLENWEFTFGRGYQTKAVPGVWGALSKVTGEFDTRIVTRAEVPRLDHDGDPIPGAVIKGATTITLDDDEADLARGGRLWIQGGTPTLPITDPDHYSFGALRCAVDNLNGDNVEWIGYPTGYEHVFCYAYYVRPAVTSGTIVVRKQLVDVPPGTGTQTFKFVGDISYNPGGLFTIQASASTPGQASFDRAGGRTWSFTEQPTAGAKLVDLACSSKTGASSASTNVATGATTVSLVAGDTVTCTYTNSLVPPPGLLLRKVTLGGVGAFAFDVKGQGKSVTATATTTSPGIAAAAEPQAATQALAPGDYTVTERLPDSDGGTWTKVSHDCGPQARGRRRSAVTVPVTIPAQGGLLCTFVDRFVPAGSIRLRKVTLGGLGTARFVISPTSGTERDLEQVATTTEEGVPATAKPDNAAHLPLGTYTIQETMPSSGAESGDWKLAAVLCDGEPTPSSSGIVTVTLTEESPSADCTFTNELLPAPEPEPEPAPEPPIPSPLPPPAPVPDGGVAGGGAEAAPDLVVTKSVSPSRVTVGRLVRYRVTVRNRGSATAERVTLVEERSATGRALRLRSSKGHCRGRVPRYCALGSLRPGERVVVIVTLRPLRTGRFTNTVAVNTVSVQETQARKSASATLRVLPLPRPRFTG